MKMVMIIVDESKREELEVFLEQSGVVGYTELSHAAGKGESGLRLGSSAFPRSSAVVFSILDEAPLQALVEGVEAFCSDCGEELHMVAWDIDVLH